MFRKAPRWGGLLLSGGLLLVLAQGVIRLPEVEGRLFPEKRWEAKLSLVQGECHKVASNLETLSLTLLALNPDLALRLSSGVLPNSWTQGRLQLPDLLGYLFPELSRERKLRLAKKASNNATIKLRYIETTLEALDRPLESMHPQSRGPDSGSNRPRQDLERSQALRRCCREHQRTLDELLTQLKVVLESQDQKK